MKDLEKRMLDSKNKSNKRKDVAQLKLYGIPSNMVFL